MTKTKFFALLATAAVIGFTAPAQAQLNVGADSDTSIGSDIGVDTSTVDSAAEINTDTTADLDADANDGLAEDEDNTAVDMDSSARVGTDVRSETEVMDDEVYPDSAIGANADTDASVGADVDDSIGADVDAGGDSGLSIDN